MARRVTGGDKNEKSGKTWTRAELEEVFKLYFELGGKTLHEKNPIIIELGEKLGRTTRSVEAQMIMFRSMDRGGEYGFKKMNTLIEKLWKEKNSDRPINPPAMNNTLDELFNWFGHRKGGVKIAFTDRGNPTSSIIQTDLILALDKWIETISIAKLNPALKLFFVGGPGNGKTEGLDYAIKKINSAFQLPSEVLSQVKEQAKDPKRIISVEIKKKNVPFKTIKLIQDASLGASHDVNAAMSMLLDYPSIVDDTTLYVCCINRGILQDVLSLAKSRGAETEFDFFNQLASSIDTNGEEINNTWPTSIKIPGKEVPVAIWPMEVSSLFESVKKSVNETSPFQQVLTTALANTGWDDLISFYGDNNLNINYCPLLNNYSTFKNNKGIVIQNLISEYELLANRRLTFREMLSLTVYLLIGHENDFATGNRTVPIKKFMSNIISHLRDNTGQMLGYETCFDLAMLQIEFKLFNKWPDISTITRDTSWKRFIDTNRATGKYKACEAFQRILSKPSISVKRTDLEKMLQHLGSILDPGKLYVNHEYTVDFNPSKIDLALQDSVEALSISLINCSALNTIDKEVLSFFKKVEEELDEIRIINKENGLNSVVERLNFILKKVAATYVKRKLGGFHGISSETINIKSYREFDGNSKSLVKMINDLLGIQHLADFSGQSLGEIDIGINSTFGQPDFANAGLTYRNSIKYSTGVYQPRGVNCVQPISDSKFFKLSISSDKKGKKIFYIPLTYHFYNALMDINSGLKRGTLPRDIAATFDRMKSFMEGASVRDIENSLLIFQNSKEIKVSEILKAK